MKSKISNLQQGVSMIEVLVTLFILTLGLLGLVGLQARLQISELESYQRAQALLLLNDMANRIANNRNTASSYITENPLGSGMTCETVSSSSTRQQIDSSEWCNALQGAAETISDSKVGAMVGGRGCIEDLGNNEYMITVAWQGMAPLSAPPASVSCGLNSYNGPAGNSCNDDLCRRTVTTIVRIATLD